MGDNAGKGSMHQRPLIFKARVHLRASRRLLAWPLFLTLLALPTLLPWPWGTVEFEEFALLYGAFLAPLMAAWVVPHLILADPGRALVASTRSGLPRIAIEKLGVLLGFFGVLWTLFLGVAWGTYSIRILDSDQFPVGLESITRLWTSGTAGILFFTACSFLLSSWSGVQAGGLLATGLWIVGIYVGRSSPDASVWTPFLGFFDLYHDVFWGQHGLLAALALILLYAATRMSRARSTGPGRRTPWLTAVRPATATEDAAAATVSPRRGFRTLVRLEWHWALRRKTLWVYTGVLAGLLLILFAILPATPDVYLTDVMPSLLFVSPLLLTLFVASAFSRNGTLQYDWYWCTPAVWTKALWAKLAAHGTLALALTTALAMATIVSLVLRDGWPWRDMAVLMVPFWALTVIATLGQVLIVVGLTLILRHTLAVLAVVCTLAVGLYLGFLTPTLTLLDLRDHTLASLFFSPITGFAPDFQAAVRLVLLYLSGGLLLWIAALLLFPHWEHRATWTRTGQWSMVALAGAGGLLVLGVGLWFHGAVNAGRVPRSITVPEDVWTVRAVEYHAQFRDGVLTAESRLELVLVPGQTSDAIVLRLNPGLQLQEVTLADRPVSWERQPESVYLSLPAAVSADGISLSLRYGGRPVLPREDYVLTNTAVSAGRHFVRHFPRETVSYANAQFLQWFRDSDWIAWPVSGGPQVGTQTNVWEIAVPPDAYPYLFSPGASRVTQDDWVHWRWPDAPPSVLLIAGAYQSGVTANGTPVWLGPYQTDTDRARAAMSLQGQARLAAWWGTGGDNGQLVYFPFGQRMHFSDSTLFLPAGSTSYLPRQDPERLIMAVRLSEDWLQEQVAWQVPPVSATGLVRDFATTCDFPTEQQRQDRIEVCQYAKDFGRNPQVPWGRRGSYEFCLYPEVRQCGAISPMRRALAIALAYHVTADPAWVGDAWEQWHDLAHATHYTLDERVLAGELDSPFHDVCSMVTHLLTIHVLVETHGTDFLRQWVALMAERHPPGRGQPVEGEFWDLAADLLGTPPVPHPDPACVTTRLKDDGA